MKDGMKLYFLRHGNADWPRWDRPDDERPLNAEGIAEMERVAAFLAARGLRPGTILSSPLPRARQTAEIVGRALGMGVTLEPLLAHSFDRAALDHLVAAHPGKALMLVGHEPGFSDVVGELTGGDVKMEKAGLARVDVDGPGSPGRLTWLIPPRISAYPG
jgi:phosphohistidine phosphatase